MSNRTRSLRDAFGFSLKGLRTAASYAAVMAVADDGINRAWDERLRHAQDNEPVCDIEHGTINGRFWLSRRDRAT